LQTYHQISINSVNDCISYPSIHLRRLFRCPLKQPRRRDGQCARVCNHQTCVQNVFHVLEYNSKTWTPRPDRLIYELTVEMFPLFDQAFDRHHKSGCGTQADCAVQFPTIYLIVYCRLRSGLLAGHIAGPMKSGVSRLRPRLSHWIDRRSTEHCSAWRLTAVSNDVLETKIFCHRSIASCLPPPVVIIFGRRTVSSAVLRAPVHVSAIVHFLLPDKELEQSAVTSPSAWFVTRQFLTEAENVFCCSRHQRPYYTFRRCVQIRLLTYLLTLMPQYYQPDTCKSEVLL